ncbi:MAG: glycine zipper family protein [Betaproteobacteria bacterium]|nr:glycine zipper family protein [Betaproteobacteria bacterium]
MKTMVRDRRARSSVLLAAAGVLLGACTVMPTGPSVMALPGSSKSIGQYQVDVADCQQYAYAVVAASGGGTAAAADNNAASAAAAGVVLGAATGAIIGSATGQASQGAAIGAGTGLLFGGAAGSSYTAMSSYQLQRGYDSAYLQCMYSRGNRIPMPRGYSGGPSRPTYLGTPPASASYPPPNTPPPPGLAGASVPRASPPTGYPPPPNVPPSSYPPPDAPPPADIPRSR